MDNLISVIVPVYNSEKYLPKCLESIINQSYDHLEIILIDDGSVDFSLNICHEYAKRDDRIKVLHQENRGPSATMNRGLDFAQGTFIAFVDCDDYLHSQMYEVLYNNLMEHKADISICGYTKVFEEDERIEEICIGENISLYNNMEALEKLCDELINVEVWNKLYKKEIFHNLRYEVGIMHEDAFIVHRILHKAKKIVHSDQSLYFYLQRSSSIMGQKFNLTRLDHLKALEDRMLFFLEKEYTELYKKTLNHYLNCIQVYYCLVSEFFPKEKVVLEDLRNKHRNFHGDIKKLSRITKVRYNIFSINPFLFKACINFWKMMKSVRVSA